SVVILHSRVQPDELKPAASVGPKASSEVMWPRQRGAALFPALATRQLVTMQTLTDQSVHSACTDRSRPVRALRRATMKNVIGVVDVGRSGPSKAGLPAGLRDAGLTTSLPVERPHHCTPVELDAMRVARPVRGRLSRVISLAGRSAIYALRCSNP